MGKERVRTLNCLTVGRALVAILVMLAHANLIIDRNMFNGIFIPGWCGVDFFFILSGFLIYHIYSANKADGVKWLKGRFIRIYPTYWVYSAVVIIIHFAYFVLTKIGGCSYHGFPWMRQA